MELFVIIVTIFIIDQVDKMVYIKSLTTGDRTLLGKVTYTISVNVNGEVIQCECHAEQTLVLPSLDPFDITVAINSMQVCIHQTFLVKTTFIIIYRR